MHSLHGSPRALSPYPPAQDVLPPRQNAELLKLPGVRLQVGTGAGLPSATAPEPAIEGKQLTAGGEAWRAAAAADMKARLAVEAAITAAAAAASGSGGADGTEAVEAIWPIMAPLGVQVIRCMVEGVGASEAAQDVCRQVYDDERVGSLQNYHAALLRCKREPTFDEYARTSS